MVLTTGNGLAAKAKIVHSAHPDHGTAYRQFVEDAKVDFEKRNPDIEIEVIPGTSFDKALTMAAAGVAPDIYDGSTNTAYSYYSAGLLLDLRPLVEKDKSFSITELVPPSLSGYQVRNTLFGLPISIFQILCFYNRDMFLEAGIADPGDLGEGWTWESAIAAGKRLTRDLDSDGNLDQWGVEVNSSFYRWPIFAHQAGGLLFDRLDEPTKPTFTSPAGRAGLGFLTDLFATHNIAFDINRMWDGYKFFYAGKIGFSLVDGPSLLGSMPREVGDRFEWDVSQLPKGPDNNGTMLT
jgi:multiple sugar transport system substrate-binding protein